MKLNRTHSSPGSSISNPLGFLILLVNFGLLASQAGYCKSRVLTEVKVTLFGQPCYLKGPLEKTVLTRIHSLGPESVFIELNSRNSHQALKQASAVLSHISSVPEFPPEVDQALGGYRKKLLARVDAQIAYLNGLERLKKFHDADQFMKAVSGHLKNASEVEKRAKRLAQDGQNKTGLATQAAYEELSEAYSQHIEPDPENDFHRGIKQLSLSYNCSFDNFSESFENEELPVELKK